MLKESLNRILKSEKFRKLLKIYKVKRIALFGSYAHGKARRNSDIDFLVEFDKRVDLLDQIGLKQDLGDLFKKEVDVVTPRALNQHIRQKILNEAVYL